MRNSFSDSIDSCANQLDSDQPKVEGRDFSRPFRLRFVRNSAPFDAYESLCLTSPVNACTHAHNWVGHTLRFGGNSKRN